MPTSFQASIQNDATETVLQDAGEPVVYEYPASGTVNAALQMKVTRPQINLIASSHVPDAVLIGKMGIGMVQCDRVFLFGANAFAPYPGFPKIEHIIYWRGRPFIINAIKTNDYTGNVLVTANIYQGSR